MEGPRHRADWDGLAARAGEEIGVSSWLPVDQRLVDGFADLTQDRYFLHVDPERAARTPLGGTIAHGLLTLAMLAQMSYEVCPFVDGAAYPLNYGFDRVRFVAPVPVGARIRGRFVLRRAEVVGPLQRQLVYDVTVEIEGAPRPALVAEWVLRYVMPDAASGSDLPPEPFPPA